jgi:hypothetical protein
MIPYRFKDKDGNWSTTYSPNLGGRLRVLHDQEEQLSIKTEGVKLEPDFAVVKTTIITSKGSFDGTGTASSQRDKRLGDVLIELAESRSIARAARFAGIGVEFCSAEELSHLSDNGPTGQRSRQSQTGPRQPRRESSSPRPPDKVFPKEGDTPPLDKAVAQFIDWMAREFEKMGLDEDGCSAAIKRLCDSWKMENIEDIDPQKIGKAKHFLTELVPKYLHEAGYTVDADYLSKRR